MGSTSPGSTKKNGDMALASFRAVSLEIGQLLERQMPGVNYAEIEPQLARLVDIVHRNPALIDLFEREFSSLLALKNFGAVEILQYSMHILRWASIREAAKRAFRENEDLRRRRMYERILDAFEPDWEDRDMFIRFRNNAE